MSRLSLALGPGPGGGVGAKKRARRLRCSRVCDRNGVGPSHCMAWRRPCRRSGILDRCIMLSLGLEVMQRLSK